MIKPKINLSIILIYLFLSFMYSESFAGDLIPKFEKEDFQVENYNFFNNNRFDAPGNENFFRLYFQENKLRVAMYRDISYNSADLEYDEEYVAYYSIWGELEFAYFRYLKNKNVDDEYCFGTIKKNKTENYCDYRTEDKGVLIKKTQNIKIKIPSTVNKLQTLVLELKEKSKQRNLFSHITNINTQLRRPKNEEEVNIIHHKVPIKESPSIESKTLKILYPYQKVKLIEVITDKNEKWAKVFVTDNFKEENGEPLDGYVNLDFLSLIDESKDRFERSILENKDSYWVKNSCSRSIPYSIMEESNFFSNPKDGIFIESKDIGKDLEIQIEHKGCGEYWLTVNYILKNKNIKMIPNDTFWINQYLNLLVLTDNKILISKESRGLPFEIKEVIKVIRKKQIQKKRIIYGRNYRFSDNELGQYFRFYKPKTKLKGIFLKVDFIINL
ncbi:MAG TPA: hypothetical protein PK079_03280 [Leptospiraceae bacterium]|nr:hypothetical protein [Leptospiraceae bacterium]HMW03776.1 hypothetical protein [Leptospiraceae bacterium]HMX34258.1 hypothetical protein [Leptospiraceae bacterium]HMY29756.1 hypothetical protein [Leptospiraceae bacterium]HMZ62845.1 hypothetical protein [Leptospiraceae bacterium]